MGAIRGSPLDLSVDPPHASIIVLFQAAIKRLFSVSRTGFTSYAVRANWRVRDSYPNGQQEAKNVWDPDGTERYGTAGRFSVDYVVQVTQTWLTRAFHPRFAIHAWYHIGALGKRMHFSRSSNDLHSCSP